MQLLLAVAYLILTLVLVLLIVRIVLDVVQTFAPAWRPQGAVLVGASAVYSVTDPPVRALRRRIPPLRLGGVGIDVAYMVAYLAVVLLRLVVFQLAVRL